MFIATLLLQDALGVTLPWSFSTASPGMSACWLERRLSPNVELSKLLMTIITL